MRRTSLLIAGWNRLRSIGLTVRYDPPGAGLPGAVVVWVIVATASVIGQLGWLN